MRTERGLSRLIGFSDGVVAIAITLLILPLVTTATTIDAPIGQFLAENAYQLFVFVLSFVVIARFWLVHHEMFENLATYSYPLAWATLLWLLSIVFLPFPTQLLATADRNDSLTYALYIGTMALTAGASLLQQSIIVRTPQLQLEQVRGTLRVLPYITIVVIMLVALAIAVLVPSVGLLSLLLLIVATPLERLIAHIRTKKAA